MCISLQIVDDELLVDRYVVEAAGNGHSIVVQGGAVDGKQQTNDCLGLSDVKVHTHESDEMRKQCSTPCLVNLEQMPALLQLLFSQK
jgi:hypothetical protein